MPKVAKGNTEPERNPFWPFRVNQMRPHHDWIEWWESWQNAKTAKDLKGLLHCGFDIVPVFGQGNRVDGPSQTTDRITLYLQVAEGWQDVDHYGHDVWQRLNYGRNKDGKLDHKTPPEIRLDLAQKAITILCQHFFNRPLMASEFSRDFNSDWEYVICSEYLLPKVMRFFRLKKTFDMTGR